MVEVLVDPGIPWQWEMYYIIWRRLFCFCQGDSTPTWHRRNFFFVIHIKRKLKRKRKQKRNGWSNLRGGGRFAPPSQVPPLALLFSFSFWFTLNLNFQSRRADLPRKKNRRADLPREKKWKNRSVSQTIDLVVTIRNLAGSSKSELSSGIFGNFKAWKKSSKFVL